MVKANKVGLTKADVFTLADSDKAKTNAERLQRIWEELPEDRRTMSRAVWIFARTRILVALLLMMVSLILQFIGPVSISSDLFNISEKYIKIISISEPSLEASPG